MASIYADKPWLRRYPAAVPAELPLPDRSMIDVLEATAAAQPDAPALHYFDDTLSYAELNDLADRFAAVLAAHGIGKGDRIAVYTQNNPHFVISVFGAWKRGAIVVPLNPMFKEHELEYHLNDSGARLLVALDALFEAYGRAVIEKTQVETVLVGHESDFVTNPSAIPALAQTKKRLVPGTLDYVTALREARPDPANRTAVAPDDVAFLVYTSGTTGKPKGAMNLHSNLVFNAEVYRTWMDLGPNDKVLALAPLFHITGIVGHMCVAALAGMPMVILHRFDPDVYLHYTEKWRPTMTVGSITAFIALMNAPSAERRDFTSVTKCYSGGAPIAPSVVEQFQAKMGAYIHNIYGLTESNSPLTMVPLGTRAPVDPASGALSVGLPVTNCEARIVHLDDPAKDVPPGEQGQLAVRGPMIFAGYWNRPEATAEAFHDGWFLTGDVAVMDADGYVYIVDRKKDMINASGFKVWPREVEDVLYQHPAVREAAVVGVPDPYRGETVKAFVALKADYVGKVSEDDIREFCKSRMAAYKYPRIVEFLDEVPKTATGKFLRRELRERSQPAG